MARTKLYRRISFFVVHRILRTDNSPSRIARGVAIGTFIAWLPLMGLQMLLVLVLSFIFRANKLVGLPIVWISNIFTLVPVYYPSYLLGSAVLKSQLVSIKDFESRLKEIFTSSLPWAGRIKDFANLLFGDIFYPTFIGSLITGSILALASYFLTIWAIRRHRQHRINRRAQRMSCLSEKINCTPTNEPNQISSQMQEPESKAG